MTIIATGIDLAKNVFALHGVDAKGEVQLRQPKVTRGKLLEVVAALPPCVIGIEACSGAHHWARLFPRSHHQADSPEACGTLPYEWKEGQERRGRCGGHLRGCAAPEHALRAGQDRRTTVSVDGAPGTPRLC